MSQFRGGRPSKSAEKATGIVIYSHSPLQTCRAASLSTLSSADSGGDNQMQNENDHHAHGEQPAAPSSSKQDVANRRNQNTHTLGAIKIVNKSLRNKSGKLKAGGNGGRSTRSTTKATWCRPIRREGKVETCIGIAKAEWDNKLTTLRITEKHKSVRKLANEQNLSNGMRWEADFGDKKNMSSAITPGFAFNMAKGYLV